MTSEQAPLQRSLNAEFVTASEAWQSSACHTQAVARRRLDRHASLAMTRGGRTVTACARRVTSSALAMTSCVDSVTRSVRMLAKRA